MQFMYIHIAWFWLRAKIKDLDFTEQLGLMGMDIYFYMLAHLYICTYVCLAV